MRIKAIENNSFSEKSPVLPVSSKTTRFQRGPFLKHPGPDSRVRESGQGWKNRPEDPGRLSEDAFGTVFRSLHFYRWIDRQASRQTDKRTDRRADRWTD